jgi:CBS domain-containing protein
MTRAIRDLMTTRVLTVAPEDPLSQAVTLLRRYGFSAVPVVDGGRRVVGIVSLLDVIRFREVEPAAGEVPVAEVMNPDVVTITPTTNAAVAAHRMRLYGELRMLPVVERGALVGVVTRSDLLRPRPPSGLRGWWTRWSREAAESEEILRELDRPRPNRPAAPDDAPVTAAMTADVVTVTPADPLSVAVALLTRHRFTALPVVEPERRLVGIVSEADALGDPLWTRGRPATVAEVMTRRPVTVDAGATVAQARRVVAERGVRVLPVVDGGRLVGIVTRRDLVR